MMDFWTILDLKSTTDISAIKKAYASKLKIFHPEDDPEGFQRLRLAYENALKFAKYNQKAAATVAKVQLAQPPYTPADCNQDLVKILPPISFDTNRNALITTEELASEFIGKVKTLYNDPVFKKDVNRWKSLLEDEKYWNIEVKQRLNIQLLRFLANPDLSQELSPYQKLAPYRVSDCNLPYEVWELFNTFFFWTEQERELYRLFPKDFLDFVWEKIHFRREQKERRKLKNIVRRYIPVGKNPLLWVGKILLAILAVGLLIGAGAPGVGIAILFYCLRHK